MHKTTTVVFEPLPNWQRELE